MEAKQIYHVLKSIVEPIHSHDDQMVAIAMWVESEFTYNPSRKLEKAAPDLLKSCLTAKAMYEAQGINEHSIIGGDQYLSLLKAIKKATE